MATFNNTYARIVVDAAVYVNAPIPTTIAQAVEMVKTDREILVHNREDTPELLAESDALIKSIQADGIPMLDDSSIACIRKFAPKVAIPAQS